jgi:hypothetical protein
MWEKFLVTLALAIIQAIVNAQKVKAGEQAVVDVGTYKLVIVGQSWLLRARDLPDGGAGLRVVDPDARLVIQTGVCPADFDREPPFCPLRRESPTDRPV